MLLTWCTRREHPCGFSGRLRPSGAQRQISRHPPSRGRRPLRTSSFRFARGRNRVPRWLINDASNTGALLAIRHHLHTAAFSCRKVQLPKTLVLSFERHAALRSPDMELRVATRGSGRTGVGSALPQVCPARKGWASCRGPPARRPWAGRRGLPGERCVHLSFSSSLRVPAPQAAISRYHPRLSRHRHPRAQFRRRWSCSRPPQARDMTKAATIIYAAAGQHTSHADHPPARCSIAARYVVARWAAERAAATPHSGSTDNAGLDVLPVLNCRAPDADLATSSSGHADA